MGFNKETGYPYCIADVDIIDVNHELGQKFKFSELETYGRGDMSKKLLSISRALRRKLKANLLPY